MKTVELRLPFTEKILRVSGSEKDESVIGAIEKGNGFYEPHVMNLLSKIVKPDYVCLDIGANIGVISLAFGLLTKGGTVHSFEPSKNNFRYLEYNIQQNNLSNINPINLGIYDTTCETTFSYVEKVAGCSFMSDVGVKEGIPEIVKCVRLDDWVHESKLKRLDLIKLDVEGAEIKVINGGINSFTNLKPDLIIEYNPTPIKRFFNENPEKLYKLLATIYPYIYLINDAKGALIKISDYSQLNNIVTKGKGWEDLFCSKTQYT